MKKIIFLFFCIPLFAQSPTSRIANFGANIKSIYIGAVEHCNIFFHSPDSTHTQIACYDTDGNLPYNVITIPQLRGHSTSWAFPDGVITWLITDTTFEISARAAGDTTESKLKGTF